MKLVAILINYRTPELTLEATRALLAELRGVASYQVIVVDNDSQDGSAESLARELEPEGVLVLAAPRNGGYGYGINCAVRAAMAADYRAEYYFVINTDAFAGPGSVQRLIAFMDEHPRAGLAGSRVHDEAGVTQGAAFRFPGIASEFEGAARLGVISRLLPKSSVAMPVPSEDTRVDWVPGTSMLIRAEVFARSIWFDERFFLYFEEVDFARRVLNHGFEVWSVKDAPIRHQGSVSTGLHDERKPWPNYWFDSRRRYFFKHHGARYALACDGARALGQLLYLAKCTLKQQPFDERPRMVRGMAGAVLRWPFMERGDTGSIGLLAQWVEDFATHGRAWTEPGFWAIATHRLLARAAHVDAGLGGVLRQLPPHVLGTLVDWVWSVRIAPNVELGRRVRLRHAASMLLEAQSIGDDVIIDHDTTLGPLRGNAGPDAPRPVIEDEVEIRSGASVLGGTTVGRGALVCNNSTVLRSVPPRSVVLGVPAKVVSERGLSEASSLAGDSSGNGKTRDAERAHR